MKTPSRQVTEHLKEVISGQISIVQGHLDFSETIDPFFIRVHALTMIQMAEALMEPNERLNLSTEPRIDAEA